VHILIDTHACAFKHCNVRDATAATLTPCIPIGLGLNIEIKYPVEKAVEWLSFTSFYEINAYVDTILDVVFEHAQDRRIVFSSFAPDVCTALALKQARYPVCFLTEAGKSKGEYSDWRCCSLGAALAFAEHEHLSGVVADSEPLFNDDSGA
jgi:glycerophosphodiester phosphodiesterase